MNLIHQARYVRYLIRLLFIAIHDPFDTPLSFKDNDDDDGEIFEEIRLFFWRKSSCQSIRAEKKLLLCVQNNLLYHK